MSTRHAVQSNAIDAARANRKLAAVAEELEMEESGAAAGTSGGVKKYAPPPVVLTREEIKKREFFASVRLGVEGFRETRCFMRQL